MEQITKQALRNVGMFKLFLIIIYLLLFQTINVESCLAGSIRRFILKSCQTSREMTHVIHVNGNNKNLLTFVNMIYLF